MEYDNNRPFSSEGAAQERKRKHALGKGVIIGVVATLLVVILALSCVFMGLIRSGNIHIGIDGRIYVQDVGTSDNEGIGTKVEGKLNALDSLLGDGFYFDNVDDEKAADNIFKAYLAAYGDKYTVYYTPEEYKSMMESTSGSFYGIGAVCQKTDDGSILISEAYEDAPAYKAGIRNGDKVTEVNGEDITGYDINHRANAGIGYAFQQPPRFKGMTVSRLLTLAAGKKLPEKEVCRLLTDVGLCARDYINRQIDGTLSGGEMKRIEIASVLAKEHSLCIFDEPEAGIDLWSFSMLIQKFEEIHKQKKQSLIVISHQEKIINMADKIMIIDNGKISKTGDKDEILPCLGGIQKCHKCVERR